MLMKAHPFIHKYVLQDIEEDLKVILTDRDWHKRYYREIDDVYYLKFIWKQNWIHQLQGNKTFSTCGLVIQNKVVRVYLC